MPQKNTTGSTISRLGVLTVLAYNSLPENQVDEATRAIYRTELHQILSGKAGVPSEKVKVRSAERCIAGGALITIGSVGIYGAN